MKKNSIDNVKSALLAMQRYSWEQGVCAQAFLESGEYDIVVRLCCEAVNRQTPDGRLANIGGMHAVTDPISIIPALIKSCEITKDPTLEKALDKAWQWTLHDAPRSRNGIVYHMDNSRQYWVDSIYMLPPALLSGGYANEAILQADGYIRALWDTEKKLFRHIWDEEKQEFVIAEYWGVGNGWAIAGLSRLIEHLPENKKADRERYIDIVNKTINAAMTLRDGDYFHNFLDKQDSFIEINFAQMLCYTIAKGVGQGWLTEEFLDEARQIRQTIHSHVTPYGFVTDVCGAPHFNTPGIAPEGQAFFILMETVFE